MTELSCSFDPKTILLSFACDVSQSSMFSHSPVIKESTSSNDVFRHKFLIYLFKNYI